MSKNLTSLFLGAVVFCIFSVLQMPPVFSLDPQSTTFSISVETKDTNSITDTQKIEQLLDDLENNWNQHKIDKVLRHYADDFVNGDGLSLEAVKNLTLELWEAYPDIFTKADSRSIRVYGDYATVESTDLYQGTSSMIRTEVASKGTLKALSMGELFLKKYGSVWKITSDKTKFEKVSIGYGLGIEVVDENKIKLIAPEQTVSGQQYTAKLDFQLPNEIKPIASISKEVLTYPQVIGEDKFRLINEPSLERLLSANKISKNELVTATVGLTGGPLKPKLLGLIFLSKRVNVISVSNQSSEVSIITTPAKSALNKSVELLDTYPHEHKDEPKNSLQENTTDDSNNSDSKK